MGKKNPVALMMAKHKAELDDARYAGFLYAVDLLKIVIQNVNLNGLSKDDQIKAIEEEMHRLTIEEYQKDPELYIERFADFIRKEEEK